MTPFDRWLKSWVYKPAKMTRREVFIARAAFIAGSLDSVADKNTSTNWAARLGRLMIRKGWWLVGYGRRLERKHDEPSRSK